jgi:outer membrane receptor for ferrienterochelin and colicins
LPYYRENAFSFPYRPWPKTRIISPILAQQRIGFGQLTWDKINKHDFFWTALRYQYYEW